MRNLSQQLCQSASQFEACICLSILAYPRCENCFTVANGDGRFAFGDISLRGRREFFRKVVATYDETRWSS